MAIGISFVNGTEGEAGRVRFRMVDFTGDSSYPSGGYTVSAREVGIGAQIFGISNVGGNAAANTYQMQYNTTTGKFQFDSGGGGEQTYIPGGGDIKGSTNGTSANADAASAPVNSVLLAAADTFTNFAGTITATVNPDVPRNVMITILNDSGGPLNLYEGTTTFTITGTDFNGSAQTETVTLTSTAGNKAVANTKFRYVQGVKAFKTVSTVTYDNAPAGGLKGSVGVGSRVGLPVALATGSVSDVLSITIDAASVTPSATTTVAGGVDTTNNAVNAGTIADGADVSITFNGLGDVPTGTNLSGVTKRIMVWGV